MMNRLKIATVSVALLSVIAATASAQITFYSSGATFAYPVYSKWFNEYAKVDPSVQFDCQAIGFDSGQSRIVAQTVDFELSDAPLSDDDLAKAPGKILHIPTVAGAVVLGYNLPGVFSNMPLKLDGETIAGIYLGTVTKWNAAAIAALNPGVQLPDTGIVAVHRGDGGGTFAYRGHPAKCPCSFCAGRREKEAQTTFIFTDYLSKVSADWRTKVGAHASVKWPVGIGANGSEGIAGVVQQRPGAIGYVEFIDALQNQMAFADLKNAAGEVVRASLDSVTAAMATAEIPDDFRFSMTNAPGREAYPIAGATWLLVCQQQRDATRGRKLVEFLKWALGDGEHIARRVEYAPLPDNVRKRVLARISEIQVP